jgi:protein-tyrosine-phosphatase
MPLEAERMKTPRVLFVCTFHGARSRIAEEFVLRLAPGRIEAYSSSFESGRIGALPIEVMKEVGIDLPRETPKSVYDRYRDKEVFDYVVTLCHAASRELCPTFLNHVNVLYAKKAERLFWSVPDFASISGTDESRRVEARKIRDQIKAQVVDFLAHIGIDTGLAQTRK